MKIKKVRLEGEQRYKRLLGGPPETSGLKSGYVQLMPGENVGEHRTEGKEEAIVFLEGIAEVVCEESGNISAEAGMLVYMPPEKLHDVKNTGDTPLKYIYLTAPVK
ncbi:MAG: cupin domain-containing protein [Candidatus Omnitrophica bacterium]|nr:cupin domain-containing protein [Candidatus Omnitrophota bacterium]